MTYFESIGSGSRVTVDETSLKTSWAKAESLLGELSLPCASAGNDSVTIEVDGIFGTSSGTYTETSSICDSSAGGTCAKTAAEVENGIDSCRDTITLGDTLRDAGDCGGRADGGVGDGVSGSAGSKVELRVDTDSLDVIRLCNLTDVDRVQHTSPLVAAQIPPVKAPLTAALASMSWDSVGLVLEQIQFAESTPRGPRPPSDTAVGKK